MYSTGNPSIVLIAVFLRNQNLLAPGNHLCRPSLFQSERFYICPLIFLSLLNITMIKRIILAALLIQFALVQCFATPDEGMWLPMYLKRIHPEMQKMGLKLSPDELYNINNSSLKDAVVWFGGYCTGEVISPDGLILTNHHCGFESIQTHSTPEKDYLKNGFWAMNRQQEIPTPGLFVSFLVRMEDVTARVLSKLNDQMTETERQQAAAAELKAIEKEATKDTKYNAQAKEFFNGNEYYLMVYETFTDVRLVGAPPSSIGKFGGDTDNWMWPRHTGDFSMFRVYAGKDNKPAEYSADNVPLKPRHFFPISLSGVKKEDFSMVMGWPGRTDRYLTSYGVQLALDISNPTRVMLRDAKLKAMKEDMDKSDKVRIQYAAKYAQIANYWKYFIGESQGLKRLDIPDKKLAEETAFQQWVNADAGRKAKYGNALTLIANAYERRRKFAMAEAFFGEGAMGPEVNQIARIFISFKDLLAQKPKDAEAKKQQQDQIKSLAERYKAALEDHWKDYNAETDKKIYKAMMQAYAEKMPKDQLAPAFADIEKKYKGDFAKLAEDVFAKTIFADKAKLNAFLDKPDLKVLEKDPALQYISSISTHWTDLRSKNIDPIMSDLNRGNRLYVEGTMEMMRGKKEFYPNANSTQRLTYGKIDDYFPRDAVYYNYFTTLEGIMEKEDPSNDEFIVPSKLKELWQKKDYGRYAENGTVPVAFISNNDITGGNSGSPVLNARGELIGCAFDGNWEAMSGNIAFEPNLQRTISVDIRYVLFIVDKYAGAGHLVNEMKLVTTPVEPKLIVDPPAPVEIPRPEGIPVKPPVKKSPVKAPLPAKKVKA